MGAPAGGKAVGTVAGTVAAGVDGWSSLGRGVCIACCSVPYKISCTVTFGVRQQQNA